MRNGLIAFAAFGFLVGGCGNSQPSTPTEAYRLVHAIGNTENVVARGLSKSECEAQKSELKQVASALGTYNEATGHGSITCLSEQYF